MRHLQIAVFSIFLALSTACGGGGGGGGGGGTTTPVGFNITTTALPNAIVDTPYSETLSAINGTGPLTWTIVQGNLAPIGLQLNPNGTITGTPNLNTSGAITVEVTDSSSPPQTAQANVTLTIDPIPLVIEPDVLPFGHLTNAYAFQLSAAGGVQPFNWTANSLPTGITISAQGFLSGIPAATGTTAVTFTVTDSLGATAQKTLNLEVRPVPLATVSGQWTYEFVPPTANGLDFANSFSVPIPGSFVALIDPLVPNEIFSAGITDASGNYTLPSPTNTTVRVVVFSLRSSNSGVAVVVDRTSTAAVKPAFAVSSTDISVGTTSLMNQNFLVPDSLRTNGPFNIIEVIFNIQSQIQNFTPNPDFGLSIIEWSPSFFSGTSFFRGPKGFILGDRNTDSDEFDDSIIGHEYTHFLQAQFSRSDSPGGLHQSNESLDPRLAYGEGEATFFAQAFLDDPIVIDTGSSAMTTSVTNLESDTEPTQGFTSELSVSKVLWDCFDNTPGESGDTVSLPLSALFTVFDQDLENNTFVYLIDFIDSLVARNPSSGTGIASILSNEAITYTPGAIPSVPNQYPIPLQSGVPLTGTVDSAKATRGPGEVRGTLADSIATYSFTISSSTTVSISLSHTGEGTTPAAPDMLDFYIFDDAGKRLFGGQLSPNSGTGYTIMASGLLQAGTYGIVVSSTRGFSGAGQPETIFSSGTFQLTVTH